MHVVYVLYNFVVKKIYIGQTKNLEDRMILHNKKVFQNSYTARFNGNWKIVYTEKCNSRVEALKREKQLKSYRGREFIKKYIPL